MKGNLFLVIFLSGVIGSGLFSLRCTTLLGVLRHDKRFRNAPPVGSVKINVDAGTSAEMRVGRTTAVVRDHLGSCVGVRSAVWERSFTRLVAELMAIGEGLRLDFELGFKDFSVESDCLQTVNLVNKDEVDCNDLEGLIRSCN